MLASEIDEAARSTYAANFGSSELVGDISGLYAGQGLPSFDVLTGDPDPVLDTTIYGHLAPVYGHITVWP